jgi:dephospho-CoA kinase
VVGLTGGIAAGKTAVADLLAARGAALIDTDLLAREVVMPGQPAYQDIAAAWPNVVRADGTLDRQALGAIVFNDEAARQRLNGMTHPRIRQLMLDRLAALQAAQDPPPMAVLVVPLLFENGLDAMVQESWLVAVSPETQLARLMGRDGAGEADARARIASQMPQEEKLKRATRVVWNDGDREALARAVDEAWREALGA